MAFDFSWLLWGLPIAFVLGWLASRYDLRQWRAERRQMPVVILSARGTWSERVEGLNLGADDYMSKPFHAAEVVARLRALARQLSGQGCEFIGHGLAANDLMHGAMPREAQREHIAHSLAAFDTVLGQRPTGWLSQDWGTSPHTFALLSAAGLRYTLDWCNDDQPYFLNAATAQGQRLLAVPLSPEWDDVQCQWLRHITPSDHARLCLEGMDRMRTECAEQKRSAVFGLTLHPWVCGMASRVGALRRLLAGMR